MPRWERAVQHETSAAVERSAAAALARAAGRGGPHALLSDWVTALLVDEDIRPAMLVEQLGVPAARLREALDAGAGGEFAAPPDSTLFAAARMLSLRLRGDPTLTTEFVLLAAVTADPRFEQAMTAFGVTSDRLTELLRTEAVATPAEEPLAPLTADPPRPPRPVPAPAPVAAEPPPPAPPPTPAAIPEPVPVPVEVTDPAAARVVDANLNRAREALRVVEDYCRFVRNDRGLTERVKALRHRLAAASGLLPPGALLAARDTPGDVGTTVTAGNEYARGSAADVAVVNLKRLQESLRSAEEFGKVFGGGFAAAVEAVRYEAYTLERAVATGTDLRARLDDARLYVLFTGSRCRGGLQKAIAEAAAGGVQVVQLREKGLDDRILLARARAVRRWTREAGVLFVMNDRPDVAKLAEADGVHVGQEDMPVAAVRQIVGPDVLIGVSTHDVEQVRKAVLDGADYLGVGPTFPSRTKQFDDFPGLEFVRQACGETSLPIFALGGIDAGNVPEVLTAGATRVAVSAAVAEAADVRAAAAELRAVLDLLMDR